MCICGFFSQTFHSIWICNHFLGDFSTGKYFICQEILNPHLYPSGFYHVSTIKNKKKIIHPRNILPEYSLRLKTFVKFWRKYKIINLRWSNLVNLGSFFWKKKAFYLQIQLILVRQFDFSLLIFTRFMSFFLISDYAHSWANTHTHIYVNHSAIILGIS